MHLGSTWISRPPCSNESVNASAAAVFAPLPITTPSPSHCLCAATRATTPYALPRPSPLELMRGYGTHSQHREAAWLESQALGCRKSLGLFRCANQHSSTGIALFPLRRPRETIYVCISTHLSSRGFQLRTATVLDSALPWVMPEIVHMARTTVVINTLFPLAQRTLMFLLP